MLSTKLAREHAPALAILLVAALLRLLLLGGKPPHFDEGVNGWFLDQMVRTGYYHYDPANYHGPLHFYGLFPFYAVMGRTIWALRLPVVLVSLASVWMVLRFDRFLPRAACLLAAAAMAVSPAMVFYGRYAIHESELVFFLLLLVWGIAGLWRFGTRQYLWAAGIAIAGIILTKETYIIHFACFGLAWVCWRLWEYVAPAEPSPRAEQLWTGRDALVVTSTCVAAILFFYSGALLDFSSLHGLYQTWAEWIRTGKEGHGHEKEWHYWLTLLRIYEWPALIGVAWSLRYAFPRCHAGMRYLAILGCGTLAAYSLVPYKTPWCVITLLWPFLFLFGDLIREGIACLRAYVEAHPSAEARPAAATVLGYGVAACLLIASAALSVRLNFFHNTDPEEKYVYVQTFDDIRQLTDPLLELARRDPGNFHLKGNFLLGSYHPLPWMLGDFSGIGYWGTAQAPEPVDADFLAVDESRVAEIEPKLTGRYFTETFRIRDSQEPAKLYFSAEHFAELFPDREPDFGP